MNPRRLLHIIHTPLILAEWLVDTLRLMLATFHESFKTLILALEKFMNEPTSEKP